MMISTKAMDAALSPEKAYTRLQVHEITAQSSSILANR
jgi:hypothetical protein